MSGRSTSGAVRSRSRSAEPEAEHRGFTRRLLGSRRSRLRKSHSYTRVLALIVLGFLLSAILPTTRLSASFLVLLQGVTLAVAIHTSGVGSLRSVPSLLALGVASLTAVLNMNVNGSNSGGTALAGAVLIAGTVYVIGIGVLDQPAVNRQSVSGAVCIYLLLGLFFVFLYGAVAQFGSGHFFAQGTDGTRPLWVYFSFVTLATLGYGDYTPAGNFGHMLAIGEALIGQLYLVTVVAVLVARLGRPLREPGEGSPGLGEELGRRSTGAPPTTDGLEGDRWR